MGCIVEHYCWDRAGITALEREVREWHLTQPVPPDSDEFGPGVQELLEFVVITPCALHDGQNAFRWGLLSRCQDSQLMRDLYISVEALRNSTDLLHSKMNSWIVQRLDFREARGLDWVCRQRDLWTALGVEADIVELLATELELCFEGSRLCVKHGAKVCVQNIFLVYEFGCFRKKHYEALGCLHSCAAGGRSRPSGDPSNSADSLLAIPLFHRVEVVDGRNQLSHDGGRGAFGFRQLLALPEGGFLFLSHRKCMYIWAVLH